jgi:chitosanase
MGFTVHDCTPAPNKANFCILHYDDPLIDGAVAHGTELHSFGSTAEAAHLSAPTAPAIAIGSTEKRTAEAIVNIFETSTVLGDYGQVTLLDGDSGHLTFGRSQTTLKSGNLAKLVDMYCQGTGAHLKHLLARYQKSLNAADLSLDEDLYFHNLLRASADDPVMRDTQDRFFDLVYWQPAQRFAAKANITSPLGVAVVYDSVIHGSWSRIAQMTSQNFGVPGDNERQWIRAYAETRLDWLKNHPNPIIRKTRYRMDTFLSLINQGKWELPLPLVVRGTEISLSSLKGVPHGCYDGPAAGSRPLAVQSPLCRGADVRQVQLALSVNEESIIADGVFGDATAKALRNYQRKAMLPETGTADPELIQKMLLV